MMPAQDLPYDAAAGSGIVTPSIRVATKTWAHFSLLSFGGPTAQISLMHKVIVEEKKWLSEGQHLNALGFCMLLPGPEAMQLATYAGWRLHGLKGGLIARLLFVLPGAVVVLALTMFYAAFGNVPVVEAIFYGIKAAVLVIVVEALLRISKRALKRPVHWLIAGTAFLGIFVFALPFPVIVATAALLGFFRSNVDPATAPAASESTAISVSVMETVGTVVTWMAIWIIPLFAVGATTIGLVALATILGRRSLAHALLTRMLQIDRWGRAIQALAGAAMIGIGTYIVAASWR